MEKKCRFWFFFFRKQPFCFYYYFPKRSQSNISAPIALGKVWFVGLRYQFFFQIQLEVVGKARIWKKHLDFYFSFFGSRLFCFYHIATFDDNDKEGYFIFFQREANPILFAPIALRKVWFVGLWYQFFYQIQLEVVGKVRIWKKNIFFDFLFSVAAFFLFLPFCLFWWWW